MIFIALSLNSNPIDMKHTNNNCELYEFENHNIETKPHNEQWYIRYRGGTIGGVSRLSNGLKLLVRPGCDDT